MAESEAAPLTGPLTLGEGAASLIVQAEPDPAPAQEAEPEAPGEAEDTATVDDAGDEDASAPEETDDTATDADDGNDDEGEIEEVEEPAADRYRYKADGEEHEASLDDLLQLASAGHNYQRKTQALAEERNQLQAERSALEEQTRAHYVERLSQIEQALGVMQEPNWTELAQQDPQEYAIQRARWDSLQSQRANIAKERQSEAQKLEQAQRQRMQQAVEQSSAALLEAVPEWRDQKRAQADLSEITQTVASNYGFKPEELAQVTDHRIILALRDVARFHKQQSKVREVKKAVKAAPKPLKPSARPPKIDPAVKRASEAKRRMAKATSRGDAIAAGKDFLLTGNG